MRVKEALAEAADKAAASYLQGCGFRILDQNWRHDSETLSIVAADRHVLVAIDLRVRAGTRHGAPLTVISAPRPALPGNLLYLAELGLDGRLRPVPGVLPAVLAAAQAETDTVIVAPDNHAEASLAPGVTVISANSLVGILNWLRGGPAPEPRLPSPASGNGPGQARPLPDLADVLGQPQGRLAAEVCAAGGHHRSLTGPPGTGKTELAERLPGILPLLDETTAIEVTSIRSVAGALEPGSGLITAPPFCMPHHTSSMASMLGGGSGPDRSRSRAEACCSSIRLRSFTGTYSTRCASRWKRAR